MSFTDFLKKVFGDKASRDRKALEPIAKQIESMGESLKAISNDELRGKIDMVRKDIADATAAPQKRIDEIRSTIESVPFDKRQPLWDEIDDNEKKILDTIEDKLNEHLPLVFAVIRE
ncbi:MAG: preprotein translocase subunit SecA, partial [Muribaculaceae bacterium]|nr:preprotein translocase subunit SecA [Muribaculaceae bacterium]